MKKIILTALTLLLLFENPTFCQQQVKVNAIQVDASFDPVSLSKLNEAVTLLESIFNSEEFARAVCHTEFNLGIFGLANYQILELIKSGNDNYKNKPKDYSIEIKVKVFNEYFGHGNFGFTDPASRITRTHRCYILHNDVKCYVSHLAHEYMHQIGFYDKKTWFLGTKTKSVPYKIGKIVDALLGNVTPCLAKDETSTQ